MGDISQSVNIGIIKMQILDIGVLGDMNLAIKYCNIHIGDIVNISDINTITAIRAQISVIFNGENSDIIAVLHRAIFNAITFGVKNNSDINIAL